MCRLSQLVRTEGMTIIIRVSRLWTRPVHQTSTQREGSTYLFKGKLIGLPFDNEVRKAKSFEPLSNGKRDVKSWLSHKWKYNCFVKFNTLTKVNLLNLINYKRHDLNNYRYEYDSSNKWIWSIHLLFVCLFKFKWNSSGMHVLSTS